MTSNRKSPIWPYLVVLAGLFLLSVAAPRGWETRPAARRELPIDKSLRRQQTGQPQHRAIVLRAKSHDARGRVVITPIEIKSVLKLAQASLFEAGSLAPSSLTAGDTVPMVEPGKAESPMFISIQDEPFDDITNLAQPQPSATAPQVATESDASDELVSEPADELAGDDAAPNYDNWPLPHALIERLKRLGQHKASRTWSADVRSLMDRLGGVRVDDPAATDLLRDLRAKAVTVSTLEAFAPAQREFESAQLDLVRRLDLWEQAAAAARQQFVLQDSPAVDASMRNALTKVAALVESAPIGNTWSEYLLLDRIDRLADDTSDEATAERHRVAQTVLARMTDARLTPAQRELLTRSPLVELKQRLRIWAVEQLPVGELLHTVEAYEQARVASLGQTLAEQSAVLVESPDPAQKRLGGELERHYRNANLRLVVTRELLDRCLPQPPPAADRVNETIVGVPTRGLSTISTRLAVRLFPANEQIRLGIEANGVVDSATSSTSGPVTLHSAGESTYFVGKLVVIDRHGLRVGRAMAEADNQSRLAGLETDFDGIPLVRNLVRSYALSEHDAKQSEAQQEVEAKVAARASERLDAEVNARLAQAEADFRRRILAPLARLDLAPDVVQLTTTEDRVTTRLRLAGDDQTGAHTPRPLALSNSLASLQLHESALNNGLDRLQLAGRSFTLPELHQWITQRLDRPGTAMPEDLPENVVVTFAAEDPVHVRCIDGRVEVTLSFAELDDGHRVWYDFQITVYYHPRLEGLRLEFFRHGPIELSGEAYAGRAAIGLRGIFAKVFSSRRTLKFEPAIDRRNAALATLEFNSALVDNGWISVTVADEKHRR
ncbi:MAG: hypothetical protein WD894_01710 [Pirellulales bacterium]